MGERGKDCCTDSNAMSIFGPQWLVEGSAEYLSYALLEDFRVLQLDRVIPEFAARVPDGINLADLETRRGFRENQGWDVGIVATHALLEESGLPSLVAFWKEIGEGTDMREAFEIAFGMSTETFYESFP